jgi:hypothetical protein
MCGDMLGCVFLCCVMKCDVEMVMIWFCMVLCYGSVDLFDVIIGCGDVVPQYVVRFGAVWW